MEAHPIPQNVTSFQFRLVGDMTLKQFIYLAAGLGLAYLIFVSVGITLPLLAWPVIVLSALLGVAFAFLPFGDRPLDHWLKAYLKAVYTPTKRVWMRDNQSYKEDPLFRTRLNLFLSSLTAAGGLAPTKEAPPARPVQPPITGANLGPRVTVPTPPPPIPSSEELSETVQLARQAHNLQQQIVRTEKDLADIKAASETPGSNTELYTERLNALLSNLQRLMRETTDIQTKMAGGERPPLPTATPKIQVVSTIPKPKVKLVLTSLPNVINGIATDSDGNYLSDVVVVVRDKDGLPVRALKTNKLGQFTGATPLVNGVYTVELEKESFVFDVLKIDLDGKLLPAINIAAKKIAGSS